MSMLDILKERLPEGLQIKSFKDRAHRSQVEIVFVCEGVETTGWLHKTCAPGHEHNICDSVINNAMMAIALEKVVSPPVLNSSLDPALTVMVFSFVSM